MSSIVRNSDGSYRLSFGDGLPFGHELADALSGATEAWSAREAARGLRAAVQALRADPAEKAVWRSIDDDFFSQNIVTEPGSIAEQAGPRVVSWLSRAPYKKLGEFCLWNQQAQVQHQAGLSAAEEALQQDALLRAQKLTDAGLYLAHALSAYEKAMTETKPLRAIDVFEAAGTWAMGLYAYGPKEISLSNLFLEAEKFSGVTDGLRETSFHEFTHAVGGTAVRGFLRSSGSRVGYRWLEEAFVAHSAAASSGCAEGVFSVDPADGSGRGPYTSERELLHILMSQGRSPLGAADLSEAYFANGTKGASTRRHVFSYLGRSIKRLLPEFRESGLPGFSAKYERLFASRRQGEWLHQSLELAWKKLGVQRQDLTDEMPDLNGVIQYSSEAC